MSDVLGGGWERRDDGAWIPRSERAHLKRRLRGALVGHLACFEMASVPIMSDLATATRRLGFDEWRVASQRYQADVARFHIETIRRLKYRPSGGL